MSDIAKVREMSDKELTDALQQAKQDLWSARFALSTRQLVILLNDAMTIDKESLAVHDEVPIARALRVSGSQRD